MTPEEIKKQAPQHKNHAADTATNPDAEATSSNQAVLVPLTMMQSVISLLKTELPMIKAEPAVRALSSCAVVVIPPGNQKSEE